MTIISTTLHHTTAEVRSHFGGAWSSLIRQRIETYGVGRFEGNSETVSLTIRSDLMLRSSSLAKACPLSCHCFEIGSPFQKQQNLSSTRHLPPLLTRVGRIYQKLEHHRGKKDHQEAFSCPQEVWQHGQGRSVQMGKANKISAAADNSHRTSIWNINLLYACTQRLRC